jgi:hypothetical protein
MTNAERLTKRLEDAGLTPQQVIDAISAVQEYMKAIKAEMKVQQGR